LRGGRLTLCAEMWADFDGSIALARVSFESGRLGRNEDRAVLCHSPSDDEGDAHTITVGSSSLDRHLAHGDYLGECDATVDDNGGDSSNGEDSEDEKDDAEEDEIDNDNDGGSPDDDADDTGEDTSDSAFAIVVDSASCDPATGHCYILARNPSGSNDRLWWDDAKAKANTMTYGGMRGHLATITSSAERQFLASVASNTPAMLGGTDRDEEGVWLWADGPESGQAIDFLPWADGEPNDLYHWTYPEGEDYLQHEGRGFNDINGARWYYVEFEPGWE
ncbi:MAG: hypothetical protein IIB57_00105, partial [Planctomycetes bacterium]|nr:hypothetical protein [Planctomycetota bacterium]